ncbi:MAG: hypothetical protein HOH58_09920 [Opitutaceae bacterium]|nr:hypothetical protein [Opitutaceae bacterium]
MSQPRLAAIAILGITTVTGAGLAYHHYQRAEELAARLAGMQSGQFNSPSERREPPPKLIAELEVPTTAKAETASKEETEATAEPEERQTNRGDRGRRDMGSRIAAMMEDPEYMAAFNLQQRARLDSTYADLFAQLDLPPNTLTRLQDLLVEKQNTTRDVFMAAREEGLGRDNRDDLRALMQETQAEIDSEIAAAIGQDKFEALQNYEQTGRERGLVDQFESRLSYSATPLNANQAQALTSILAETSTGGNRGRGGDSPWGGGGVTISDEAITRAQGVLSSDQLKSLQSLQAEQQAGQKLAEAMRSGGEDGNDSGGGRRGPTRGGGGG